jgi:anti-anti-sigma regulatory factor
MTEAFHVVAAGPESLTLRLGPRGLEDEADELFAFVAAELEAGRVSRVTLDASDARAVTLEGVGVLLRLDARARRLEAELRVTPLHPRLVQKLRETGTAGLFSVPG